MSLIARHLEAHGLPTVVLGSAYDILLAGRPPRACFVDYPLGHTVGKPFDEADQLAVVRAGLAMLADCTAPGELRTLPNEWADDGWRALAAAPSGQDSRQPRDTSAQFQLASDRDAANARGACC